MTSTESTVSRTTRLSPGLYVVAGRTYLLRSGIVRMVRANGTPSRFIVARQAGAGLQVTGNGRGHETAMHALAAGQATQVEAHCRRCGAVLTASAADGIGPECAKAVA